MRKAHVMSVKELRPSEPSPPNGTGHGQRPVKDNPVVRLRKAIYRQAPEVWDNLNPRVLGHNVYKSIYRTTAFPKTERERSEAFFNSFLLHIQPAKIKSTPCGSPTRLVSAFSRCTFF